MSHASLANALSKDGGEWKKDGRLSLAGTSDVALSFFLNQHKVKDLVFCLDNDSPGREATAKMRQKYDKKGYDVRIELPSHKDFNEDLQASIKQIKAGIQAKGKSQGISL